MMSTLKKVARETENAKYSMAVMDETGIVKDVLIENVDVATVATIERYFDMKKLAEGEYLTVIYTSDKGLRFYKEIDDAGESGWFKIGC